MKKTLAILLALIMVLGLASSALAVSWAAPSVSSSASPFSIEVIKLGINADVTGAKYYTVVTDAAAYDFSTIYYAVKLVVPSYANANAYYGNSGFLSGDKVKITVSYTNVSGKGTDTYYVQLTDASQTLWLNSRTGKFDASWVTALNNNCGCGDSHILSAIASGTKEVSIKACVGAAGELSSILVDGCYKIEEKTYYGVVPCINCAVVNLSGFLFSGNCAANGVFYATNAAGKVTGVYAVDGYGSSANYYGSLVQFDKKLYGWFPNGIMPSCSTGECNIMSFTKRQIPVGAKLSDGWTKWDNGFATNGNTQTQMAEAWDKWAKLPEVNKFESDGFYRVFYEDNEKNYKPVTKWQDIAPSGLSTQPKTKMLGGTEFKDMWWSYNYVSGITKGNKDKVTTTIDNNVKTIFEAYLYDVENTAPYPISYGNTYYVKTATSDARLFRQTGATTVNCDFNDATYLNTLNHLYALLGFTYADVAAGNVYMTKDILLTNFGFNISVCDTKTWGAYTATITVAPVAEVPATGSMSYLGFALLALAIATAAVSKKKVRG